MTKEEAKLLLEKYAQGHCSPSEERMVEAWIFSQIDINQWTWTDEEQALLTKVRIRKNLEKQIGMNTSRRFSLKKLGILASTAVTLGIAMIWGFKQKSENYRHLAVSNVIEKVVQPGSNSATLTMGDGSVIDLDELEVGVLINNDLVKVNKLNDGQLVYVQQKVQRSTKVDTNTVAIPIGGTYKIVLPDGTKVWLNAATKLKYPVLFTGVFRTVELEGEAYFEVAKNTKQPFIVRAGGTETRVTGTTFNLTAYREDNRVSTTLVEGEVYVSHGNDQVKLAPGQQSIRIANGQLKKRSADVDAVLGWKNGYFVFDDQEIETVLRDIARWYNVDIYVQNAEASGKRIGGAFSRKRDVEELLQYLEKLKVLSFKKEGRRVTVMM